MSLPFRPSPNSMPVPSFSLLQVANVYVPFVDVLGTGKPFLYNSVSFVDFIVASLVGTLTTLTNVQIGIFDPLHAAYKSVGTSDLSFGISQGITVLGIGLVQPVFQSTFHRVTTPYISANTFKAIGKSRLTSVYPT